MDDGTIYREGKDWEGGYFGHKKDGGVGKGGGDSYQNLHFRNI